MKRFRELKNLLEYIPFRLAIGLLQFLPYNTGKAILILLFDVVGYRCGIRRKLAERQLADVFPEKEKKERDRITRRMYRNMALNVTDVFLTSDKKLYEMSEWKERHYMDEALSRKKGVLLITGHFGDWESSCRLLPMDGLKFAAITKKQRNNLFDDYTNAIRKQQGCVIIDMKNALKGVLEQAKQNYVIGIVIDQDAGKRGILVDFLGKPASNWKGTAKIALKYQIPIVPGYIIHQPDDTLLLQYEPIIDPAGLEDTQENMLELIKTMNKSLEAIIRKYPEQWFWVHKRWKGARHFHK